MVVVQAKIQTVEDIYQLVRRAVMTHRPIAALYDGHRRLLCPHRLGHSSTGAARVLCYQYGGESRTGLSPAGSPDNWRCMVIEKFRRVEIVNDVWQTAPNHSRAQSCVAHVDVDAEDLVE